jgi:prepilin peptidase CpaA
MAAHLILVAWATAAAGVDARHRRLPNWLTLGGLMAGSLYALVTGFSVLGGSLTNALLAAAIGFLVLFPAYLAGWMGAGDVKLLTAMGMLGGSGTLLPTLLTGCIITGIVALALVITNRLKKDAVPSGAREKRPLPFGAGLAVGFAMSVLGVPQGLAWHG